MGSEPKAGSSSSSGPTPAQPQAASGDPFKESDVANLVKMGFPREVAIAELRKCNGDANLAIANLLPKAFRRVSTRRNREFSVDNCQLDCKYLIQQPILEKSQDRWFVDHLFVLHKDSDQRTLLRN